MALADPSCLMINRDAGVGTRVLIDQLLGGRRPPGYANQPKSHNAVVAAVAQGRRTGGLPSPLWRSSTRWPFCRSRRSATISSLSKAAVPARPSKRFSQRSRHLMCVSESRRWE